MVDEENVAEEAPDIEVAAPALPDEPVAAPANCTGELVLLPHVEGTTFNQYQCQTCGQIVTVSLEDLDEYGLPTEHSPLIN